MDINPQLLKDCQNKDRRAQFQLYKRCFSLLMGVSMRYKKDRDEAAEMVNIGFMKILKNIDKYRADAPFGAWIKRIMINTIIDEFRKNRKVKELIETTDFADFNDNAGLVDYNTADQMFDAQQLEELIKRLPPMSQKVFNLFAIDGFSHKEIGKMLDISDGTSKWHLSFARKKLREMLEQLMEQQRSRNANY